jgi:Bacterial Ig-like domain (group 1)
MKAVKLISPLVALLLITVFFAGCMTSTAETVTTNSTLPGDATTTPTATPSTSAASISPAAKVGAGITTKITASVDKQTVAGSEQFNITGTLTDSLDNPIPNQVINLDKWNGASYVYTGVRNFTDADGSFTLPRSESVAGTYNYSANFTGFANYNAIHSFPDVQVTVENRETAGLTLAVDNPNPFSGQTFNLVGKLTNLTGGIPDAKIELQRSLDGTTWSSAADPAKTGNGTDAPSGTFGFAGAITGNGTVYFRAYYSGNVTYWAAYSPIIKINVLKPATNMADFWVNDANPVTGQAFYFAGHLKTNATATNPSKALAGELVYLEVSGEGVFWTQASAPFVTDSSGLFAFTGTLNANDTYYFRAHFFGTDNARESASPTIVVKVDDSTAKLPSQASINAYPANPIEGQRLYIYGLVQSKETYPVPFANAQVYLYWSSDNTNWSLASSSPAVTNASGVYAFAGSLTDGTYYFRVHYGGSDKYSASDSSALQVICAGGQAIATLKASNITPAVNEQVTFTASLMSGTTPLADKSVEIYHTSPGGVKYTDVKTNTDSNGNVTLTTSWGSFGKRPYYATFAGDSQYTSSTSKVVEINVGAAQVALTASTSTPAVNEQVTFTATLTTDGKTPISGKSVTIYHLSPGGVRYNDTNAPTGSDGKITFKTSWGSFGKRPYYATFAGDSQYASATSKVVEINVGATKVALTASTSAPIVKQPVTFTATLTTDGKTPISGKSVTIYHLSPGGVRYNDITTATGPDGKITFTTSWGSTGARPYYATFAGDSQYASATSTVVNINVVSG